MKIGLLGLTFGYANTGIGNRGCEALSYSFLEILNKIGERIDSSLDVYLMVPMSLRKIDLIFHGHQYKKKQFLPDRNYRYLNLDIMPYVTYKGNNYILHNIKNLNIMFDFTFGDSFTDIYGEKRFYSLSRMKAKVIKMGVPLVLGSQTIGPFNDKMVEEFAVKIINDSYQVYVRDQISYEYTLMISGRKPVLTTDIAFFLPYEKRSQNTLGKNVGINVSGLLWSGGYTANNQFNLTIDYKEYCHSVISKLIDEGYRVHLIPHAFSDDSQSRDNDMLPTRELHEQFPETIIASGINSSIEIKTYISSMDVFIGARMHATIAAFSSGIPVIPFSYSRKFEGLFNSLGYSYIIDGKECDTTSAVEKTLEFVHNKEELKNAVSEGNKKVSTNNEFLLNSLEDLLKNLRQ